MVGDVRGAADLRLVAADEVPVLGGDDVLLDDVGAEVQGELVGAQGVLGAVAARAAVADDGRDGQGVDGNGAVRGAPLARHGGARAAEHGDAGAERRGPDQCPAPGPPALLPAALLLVRHVRSLVSAERPSGSCQATRAS